MPGYHIKCDLGLGEIVGQLLIWLLLSIITLGIAAFFLPYYMLKLPINRCTLVTPDGRNAGRLHVDFSFGDIIGHMLIWIILTIITLGLGYFVYWYYVFRRLLNATTVQPVIP